MMNKVIVVAAVAASVLAGPLEAQDPVALVIRVQGDVAVRHGSSAPAPATVGEQMFVGDGLAPSDGARAILVTRTGAQRVVTEETTLDEPRGAGNPDIFARAMRTLARAASADGSTGGRYDLMLRNLAGGPPLMFELGTETVFELPESNALERGATYAWTVFVGGRQTGRPLPQQEFRVMSLEESVELEDYMDDIAVFGLDPLTDGLFLTVVAYTDLGLFYDANDALESVERQASLSADLYLLKGEILTEMGHEEEARAAFDRADELMR